MFNYIYYILSHKPSLLDLFEIVLFLVVGLVYYGNLAILHAIAFFIPGLLIIAGLVRIRVLDPSHVGHGLEGVRLVLLYLGQITVPENAPLEHLSRQQLQRAIHITHGSLCRVEHVVKIRSQRLACAMNTIHVLQHCIDDDASNWVNAWNGVFTQTPSVSGVRREVLELRDQVGELKAQREDLTSERSSARRMLLDEQRRAEATSLLLGAAKTRVEELVNIITDRDAYIQDLGNATDRMDEELKEAWIITDTKVQEVHRLQNDLVTANDNIQSLNSTITTRDSQILLLSESKTALAAELALAREAAVATAQRHLDELAAATRVHEAHVKQLHDEHADALKAAHDTAEASQERSNHHHVLAIDGAHAAQRDLECQLESEKSASSALVVFMENTIAGCHGEIGGLSLELTKKAALVEQLEETLEIKCSEHAKELEDIKSIHVIEVANHVRELVAVQFEDSKQVDSLAHALTATSDQVKALGEDKFSLQIAIQDKNEQLVTERTTSAELVASIQTAQDTITSTGQVEINKLKEQLREAQDEIIALAKPLRDTSSSSSADAAIESLLDTPSCEVLFDEDDSEIVDGYDAFAQDLLADNERLVNELAYRDAIIDKLRASCVPTEANLLPNTTQTEEVDAVVPDSDPSDAVAEVAEEAHTRELWDTVHDQPTQIQHPGQDHWGVKLPHETEVVSSEVNIVNSAVSSNQDHRHTPCRPAFEQLFIDSQHTISELQQRLNASQQEIEDIRKTSPSPLDISFTPSAEGRQQVLEEVIAILVHDWKNPPSSIKRDPNGVLAYSDLEQWITTLIETRDDHFLSIARTVQYEYRQLHRVCEQQTHILAMHDARDEEVQQLRIAAQEQARLLLRTEDGGEPASCPTEQLKSMLQSLTDAMRAQQEHASASQTRMEAAAHARVRNAEEDRDKVQLRLEEVRDSLRVTQIQRSASDNRVGQLEAELRLLHNDSDGANGATDNAQHQKPKRPASSDDLDIANALVESLRTALEVAGKETAIRQLSLAEEHGRETARYETTIEELLDFIASLQQSAFAKHAERGPLQMQENELASITTASEAVTLSPISTPPEFQDKERETAKAELDGPNYHLQQSHNHSSDTFQFKATGGTQVKQESETEAYGMILPPAKRRRLNASDPGPIATTSDDLANDIATQLAAALQREVELKEQIAAYAADLKDADLEVVQTWQTANEAMQEIYQREQRVRRECTRTVIRYEKADARLREMLCPTCQEVMDDQTLEEEEEEEENEELGGTQDSLEESTSKRGDTIKIVTADHPAELLPISKVERHIECRSLKSHIHDDSFDAPDPLKFFQSGSKLSTTAELCLSSDLFWVIHNRTRGSPVDFVASTSSGMSGSEFIIVTQTNMASASLAQDFASIAPDDEAGSSMSTNGAVDALLQDPDWTVSSASDDDHGEGRFGDLAPPDIDWSVISMVPLRDQEQRRMGIDQSTIAGVTQQPGSITLESAPDDTRAEGPFGNLPPPEHDWTLPPITPRTSVSQYLLPSRPGSFTRTPPGLDCIRRSQTTDSNDSFASDDAPARRAFAGMTPAARKYDPHASILDHSSLNVPDGRRSVQNDLEDSVPDNSSHFQGQPTTADRFVALAEAGVFGSVPVYHLEAPATTSSVAANTKLMPVDETFRTTPPHSNYSYQHAAPGTKDGAGSGATPIFLEDGRLGNTFGHIVPAMDLSVPSIAPESPSAGDPHMPSPSPPCRANISRHTPPSSPPNFLHDLPSTINLEDRLLEFDEDEWSLGDESGSDRPSSIGVYLDVSEGRLMYQHREVSEVPDVAIEAVSSKMEDLISRNDSIDSPVAPRTTPPLPSGTSTRHSGPSHSPSNPFFIGFQAPRAVHQHSLSSLEPSPSSPTKADVLLITQSSHELEPVFENPLVEPIRGLHAKAGLPGRTTKLSTRMPRPPRSPSTNSSKARRLGQPSRCPLAPLDFNAGNTSISQQSERSTLTCTPGSVRGSKRGKKHGERLSWPVPQRVSDLFDGGDDGKV